MGDTSGFGYKFKVWKLGYNDSHAGLIEPEWHIYPEYSRDQNAEDMGKSTIFFALFGRDCFLFFHLGREYFRHYFLDIIFE